MFCLYCGASVPDDAKLCPACGSTFLVTKEPETAVQQNAKPDTQPTADPKVGHDNGRDIYSSAPHRFRPEPEMEDIYSGEELPAEPEMAEDKAAMQDTIYIDRYEDRYDDGYVYETYEEKPRRQKKGYGKIILIVVLVLVLAGLAVGGVYVYKQHNAPIRQFERALAADDYAQITRLLPQLSDEEREELSGNMKAYAAQAVKRYNRGEVDYSEAHDLVDRLQRIFHKAAEIQAAAEEIKTLKASKESFKKAQEAAEKNDVENALRLFGEVAHLDTNYKAAQTHIDAIRSEYKAAVLKEVERLSKEGDFLGAQAKLAESQKILGEDADIAEKVEALISMEQDSYVDAMLKTADEMADAGDLIGAVAFLKEATKEDMRFTERIKEYRDTYRNNMLKEAAAHAKTADYEEAVAVLETTKDFLGDDEIVAEKIKEYKDMYPVLLVDMRPTAGSNCNSILGVTGVDGNEYSSGLSFALYPEVSEKVETTYTPDGKYKRFSGTWVVTDDTTEGFTGKIRIYVDGALQYEVSSLTIKSGAKEMNLLINGAKEIRIEAEGVFTDQFQLGTVYLAGATFRN